MMKVEWHNKILHNIKQFLFIGTGTTFYNKQLKLLYFNNSYLEDILEFRCRRSQEVLIRQTEFLHNAKSKTLIKETFPKK